MLKVENLCKSLGSGLSHREQRRFDTAQAQLPLLPTRFCELSVVRGFSAHRGQENRRIN